MTKSSIAWTLVVIGSVGAAVAASRYTSHLPTKNVSSAAAHQSSSQAGDSQLPDYSDNQVLLGNSHNVFVGKVMQNVGDEPYPSSNAPTTQFAVNVILNVKGFLTGTVVVGDMHGLQPIVQSGSTYLFATRYSEETGWYVFGAPNTSQFISDDASLSDTELTSLADKNTTVVAARAAYPTEQLRGSDVDNHTAYNSYASRHYDTQGNPIDDTVVLHEQYLAAHPSAVPGASPIDTASSAAAAQAPAPNDAAPAANAPAADSVSPTSTPDQVTASDVSASTAPTDTPTPTPSV
jgi:hypothetical protein